MERNKIRRHCNLDGSAGFCCGEKRKWGITGKTIGWCLCHAVCDVCGKIEYVPIGVTRN